MPRRLAPGKLPSYDIQDMHDILDLTHPFEFQCPGD
jgi:hypothetical protein